MKKRLTQSEEFEIMKLVLDKFLWIGAIIMLYGLYMIFTQSFSTGIMWMIIGAIVLVILMVLIVKEYEVIS
jgi:drug/metabolite transporter (DMT)-like permease